LKRVKLVKKREACEELAKFLVERVSLPTKGALFEVVLNHQFSLMNKNFWLRNSARPMHYERSYLSVGLTQREGAVRGHL
jgi:hypothetical protein